MLRRFVKVLLARKRDPDHWRAEARQWKRLALQWQGELSQVRSELLQQERQRSADLLDRTLERVGSSPIQQQPEEPRPERPLDPMEMGDNEFEQFMHQQDEEAWISRAAHDQASRMYVEAQAPHNPHFQRVLAKLPNRAN